MSVNEVVREQPDSSLEAASRAALAPRVGVVGSGYWGRNLVRNFFGLGALAALCDANEQTRNEIATKHPVQLNTPHFADLLGAPEIDAVAIATPAGQHGAMVRAALQAGKDVFVEKPLCLSEREGAELVELADKLDRILMVGHLLWYHPGILKLKSLIASGQLGRVQYIYSNRLNMGKLRREENVLWSFAPHDISVILGLLGEPPESVQASGGNFLHKQIADTTISLLEFESGVRAHIFVSWLHPFKEQKLVVVGDRQMAVFDDTLPWNEKLVLYPHTVAWEGSIPVARKADAQPVQLEEKEPLREECDGDIFSTAYESVRPPRPTVPKACVSSRYSMHVSGHSSTAAASLSRQRVAPSEANYFVHESAVVDAGSTIGEGTRIWHFSHILGNTQVGARCSLGQNVMIGPDVSVGDDCKIQNNVSIYKGVNLEDGVFCGPSCVFTNVINPRAEVERKSEFLETRVRRGATIGANATIVCGVEIGQYSFVGAGAVVTRDVPAHALVVGNPARPVGWMSKHGERLTADLRCPKSGAQYRETDNGLEEVTP